jgi:hypothetical protein
LTIAIESKVYIAVLASDTVTYWFLAGGGNDNYKHSSYREVAEHKSKTKTGGITTSYIYDDCCNRTWASKWAW